MRLIVIISFLSFVFTGTAQYGSKQKVFKSFTILNDELEQSQRMQKMSNDRLYFLLVKSLSDAPNDSIMGQMDSLREKTVEIINYINTIKVLLIVKSEKLEKDHVVDQDTIINLRYISSLDDYSTPTMVLIGENRWTPIEGQYTAIELKEKLIEYQDYLLNRLSETDKTAAIGINVINDEDMGYGHSWEMTNFHNIPLGGIITFLSKIQVDIRSSEAAVINYWLQR